MTIGIDAGGSALKIALSRDGKMGHGLYENYGGRSTEEMIGTFLDACGAVNSLHVTGVHAKTCGAETFGLPTLYVPEPEAIGRGGTALAGLNEAIVASVGTGTAFVLCRNGEYTHLGGTGIGGGTILGLAGKILGFTSNNAGELDKRAARGDLRAVDLTVGDLFSGSPTLPTELTAANLAKAKAPEAQDADWAAGILNLCLQAVGSMAMLCAKAYGIKTVVLTGAVAELDFAVEAYRLFEKVYGIDYVIPPNARFATAFGAAMTV